MVVKKITRLATSVVLCAGMLAANSPELCRFIGNDGLTVQTVSAAAGELLHCTFESGAESWAGRGGATVATSGTTSFAGSKSLEVTGRTDSWNGAELALDSVSAGEKYSFSAAVSPAGSSTAEMMLTLQYSDGADAQYAHIASLSVQSGKWAVVSGDFTIPSGASDMVLFVETAKGTSDFNIDEVIIGAPGSAGGTLAGKMPGDTYGDEVINCVDASLLKRAMFNTKISAPAYSDVDSNGTIETDDLMYLQQYIHCEITEFPYLKVVGEMKTISEYTPIVQEQVVEYDAPDAKQEKAGVTYGTLKSGSYHSTTCNRNKPYNILLPANYSTDKQYPVLYVMHGYYENQDRMIIKGNNTMYTRQLIGNAIADGDAVDMIVVFPYIYSSATRDTCTGMDDENNRAYDNFINDLTKDLMPHIEQTYSVKTGRENTAITGFSMGGRESLLIGMERPDLFGYIGAICPAPGVTGSFKWDSEEEAPSLVFITAGSDDTVVYTSPEGYHNNFTKNGVPHIWHYINGGYHGDNSIHAHLYNFVRVVFKA